jgi:hypothetical protein
VSQTAPTPNAPPAAGDDLTALVRRAEQGNTSALPALREMMRKAPAVVDIFGGDLACEAQE